MLIRTQDKMGLLNMDRMDKISISACDVIGNGAYGIYEKHDTTLGIYKSKERAIKVLDEIEAAYRDSLMVHSIFSEDARGVVPYVVPENTVFPMPQE